MDGRAFAFPETERQAVYRAIYQRRDIRNFRADPISDRTLARIINAAHHGPSVGFMQPWDFILVRDVERRRQVKELFERERASAACFFDEPRRSAYLSLKLEGILEAPVNLCITCDPTRRGWCWGAIPCRKRTYIRRAAPCRTSGWRRAAKGLEWDG